jgi:hypothetical protein
MKRLRYYLGYLLVKEPHLPWPVSYEPDADDGADGAVVNAITAELMDEGNEIDCSEGR